MKLIKNKTISIMYIFVLAFQLIFCENHLHLPETFENISRDLVAFYDIVDVYIVGQKQRLEILIFSINSRDTLMLMNIFLSRLSQIYSYKLETNYSPYHYFYANFIVCKSIDFFLVVFWGANIVRYNNKPLIYLVYIPQISYSDLEYSTLINSFRNISKLTDEIFFHAFFIINESDSIILATIEWFGLICNKAVLTKINEFDKNTMKWKRKLKYYEKFRNFNGCELTMKLPISRYPNQHFWGYAMQSDDDGTYEKFGLTPIIFKILSKPFNYKTLYHQAYLEHPYKDRYISILCS